MKKPLNSTIFDAITRPSKPEELWGLSAIGGALGVSADTVSRWQRQPDCGLPVSRCGGRWFGLRSELLAWRKGRKVDAQV